MKLCLTCTCLYLALAACPCSAQTSTDLSSKYGPPVQSYEIRPGIYTTVKYAADGQACEMRVEKRHVRASGVIDVDETLLSAEESGRIVEELAPAARRGKRSEDFPRSLISSAGVGMTMTDVYEKVSITYYYSNYTQAKKKGFIRGPVALVITWRDRPCRQG